MAEKSFEVNFDGIVGPTHNYSGLSYGNLASKVNSNLQSNPREAALQNLEKMKFLADLGIKQAVLPPHERPHIPTLRRLGYTGKDSDIIARAFNEQPEILMATSSAAAMWTANAATTTPSIDAGDRRVHITPANLQMMFHRSIEAETTEAIFRKIFSNKLYFSVHHALPACEAFGDEGAANVCRFAKRAGSPGLHLFVHGRSVYRTHEILPQTYPARQTLEASIALAKQHTIYPTRVIYTQQHPYAIDAGAFHNDVVAVSNDNVFFFHESAFIEKDKLLEEITRKMEEYCDISPQFLEVNAKDISLHTAVQTYLFNSQIITLPDQTMIMVAPTECLNNYNVHKYLENLVQSQNNPISQLHYIDLRQSMQNGGGPACLRLRIILNENELAEAHQPVFLTDRLYNKLYNWITKHYRDKLLPKDLADPNLLVETRSALDELTKILELGSIYPFQQN